MTLILALNSRETIWILADRRLSAKDRVVSDNARKILTLETTDGKALLGYAGLGATSLGTEPSTWMSAVLRGRNLTFEQSLEVLAKAINNQIPKHLNKISQNTILSHSVIITALVKNKPRLYSIDLIFSKNTRSSSFRFSRWRRGTVDSSINISPRIGLAGSGGEYLYNNRDWYREALSLVNACDKRKISESVVADYLAKINYQVFEKIPDHSVGPNCIVAWLHGIGKYHKGGGGHKFYSGITRENNAPALPNISNGIDVQALCEILMPSNLSQEQIIELWEQKDFFDKDKLNEKLAKLPDYPEEDLK